MPLIWENTYSTALSKTSILDAFASVGKMVMLYRYDTEDDWEHVVELQRSLIISPDGYEMLPMCINGSQASPPEYIGGPDEYRKFCRAMARSTHRDHVKVMEAFGGVFFPSEFDLNSIVFTTKESIV